MGLYPITINTAPQTEPHIYAQDDASIYQSIFGDDCVFDIGSKFKAQTLSSNKIRLSDGVMQIGGHIARIKYGDYEDVTITNGVSGKKRVTIIAGRFQTTGTIDDMTLVTKDGVAGDTYVDPEINEGDLYQGASIREMPLYRVKLDGINIVSVEPMFYVRSREQYDVGDLYLTTNKANPASKFGGTWELFGEGRTLVCVDESQSEFNTVKKTGGEKMHTHDAGTISALIGAYDGDVAKLGYVASPKAKDVGFNYGFKGLNTDQNISSNRVNHSTPTAGNTGSTSTLQPYITCYIWIRTA